MTRLYRHAADGTVAHGCTRRAFLLAALVSVTGGVPLTNRGAFAAASLDAWRPPAWLAGITGERDAVMRLGQAYRQSCPAEQASDVLAEAVDRVLTSELDGGMHAADPLQVIAALRRVVRAEYARGEVVEVQGWVLSTTEARLYGLVAALSGGWPGTGPGGADDAH